MFQTTELLYISGALIISLLLGYLLKIVFPKIKKPNGKKGGIVSFHVIIGMSFISTIGYLTKDYIYTGIVTLLVYLIIRNKHESKQHYPYQIVCSMIIGVLPILGLILYKNKYINKKEEEDYQKEARLKAPELDLNKYENKHNKEQTITTEYYESDDDDSI